MVSSGAVSSAKSSPRPREFVQSLERGLLIIKCFSRSQRELSVSELAALSGLTRAAVRRFLITLETLGYAETDGRVYWLTPRILEIGYSYLSGLSFPSATVPHLEKLVADVDESSEAAILDLPDIVYVARVPSRNIMTVAINVGSRMPSHATALGRVQLAALSDEDLSDYLERYSPLTQYLPRTVTDPDELRRQVERARETGYALVDQELEKGLLAIAVVVRDRHDDVVGAINLSTNIGRTSRSSLLKLLPRLRETAAAIEADLASA